jgi:hypothetical protein
MYNLVKAGSLDTETAQGSTKISVSPVNCVRSYSVNVKLQTTEGRQLSC